jgi:hypothetical protein
MPYIITVNQPGYLPEADPTAVATIEEARDLAREELDTSAVNSLDVLDREDDFRANIDELPESGGVIGPLPDGYVIDVQRVPLEDLANQVDLNIDPDNLGIPVATEAEVIDAYNQGG